jgi:hypothetical protein
MVSPITSHHGVHQPFGCDTLRGANAYQGVKKCTIRPKGSSSAGGFATTAVDAQEALERVKELVERGLTEVQISIPLGSHTTLLI